jgi:cell division septation protein DedD
VERTATHETEYVDIVLGYHHILLFSLVFGVLIFGTGFFLGYYRARSDHADRAAAGATTSPEPRSSPAAASDLPPIQMPAVLTQPETPPAGDVVKEMEDVSTQTLAPEGTMPPEAPAAAAAQESTPAAVPPPSEPPAQEAAQAPAATSKAKPAATQSEQPAPANGKAAQPAEKPAPRAAAVKPSNARGSVYLQVSSFEAQREAEQLTNELAAEGFRAMIDGDLVEGRHTVLVGPFADFKSAVGQAKELKEHNREAFPIRR